MKKTLTDIQKRFSGNDNRNSLADRELGYELLENTQDYEMYQVLNGRTMINLTFYINIGKIEIEKLVWKNEDWRETSDQSLDLSVFNFIQRKTEDLGMIIDN